jgi:hypothetical protein
MPQIWMTYQELAGMLGCDETQARERAHFEGLDRKISRDGRKRAKLSMPLIAMFIEQIKAMDFNIDRAVNELRQVHGRMNDRAETIDVPPVQAPHAQGLG